MATCATLVKQFNINELFSNGKISDKEEEEEESSEDDESESSCCILSSIGRTSVSF